MIMKLNLMWILIIPPADRLGKKVLEFKDAGIKLGDKLLFRNFNFHF